MSESFSSFLRNMEVPMEERRKIPGCGINHFDPSDDVSIRAETSPVKMEEIFGPRVRTYARPIQQQPIKKRFFRCARPVGHSDGSILLSTESQCRLVVPVKRDPRFPFFTGELSPLSSSSSSSSSTSSPVPNYNQFQPIYESSVMKTPPRSLHSDRLRVPPVTRHPAFAPSYHAHTPENYSPPSSSPSPPSDQYIFFRSENNTKSFVKSLFN